MPYLSPYVTAVCYRSIACVLTRVHTAPAGRVMLGSWEKDSLKQQMACNALSGTKMVWHHNTISSFAISHADSANTSAKVKNLEVHDESSN